MFQACSDAPLPLLSVSLPLNVCTARLRKKKKKKEVPSRVTIDASYQSQGFPHPLRLSPSLPFSFSSLPLSLGTPKKKKKKKCRGKKKVISSKQLLGFAFKRTPAESVCVSVYVSVCVCVRGVHSRSCHSGGSVCPEQKAKRGRATGGENSGIESSLSGPAWLHLSGRNSTCLSAPPGPGAETDPGCLSVSLSWSLSSSTV